MYRKYYLVEVVILLLLSHGGWNGPSVTLLSCTSESSKLIRDVVQKQIVPVVSRYGVSLPLECPLHPRRDAFWWLHTDVEDFDGYKCPVCGEIFPCETKFVTHWDTSHSKNLLLTEDSVCLDDYCDVFRCSVLRQKRELAKRREQIIASSTNQEQLEELDAEDDTARQKEQCEEKSMDALRERCRTVIRQCTIGMVVNLSTKDFQDLEDDLDLAVCSYLTCEKYWDDFSARLHFIPTLVGVIIVLMVFTGFCLCYYGAWLMMENQAITSDHVCCSCRKQRAEPRLRRERHHQIPKTNMQERERENEQFRKWCNGYDNSSTNQQTKFKTSKILPSNISSREQLGRTFGVKVQEN